LAKKPDLRTQAGQFAEQLTDLLNHTITDGVRIKSIFRRDLGRVWAGHQITQGNPWPGRTIPIRRPGAKSHCWLHVQYTLQQDPGGYLTVIESTFALHLGEDPGSASVFHYDYNRDSPTAYPEAHVQVPGQSWMLGELGERLGRTWELGQLHFPVGSRRFRPCLEDVVEFLIVEGFAEPRDGWKEVIEEHRQEFHRRQLGAAVRRDPETAERALAEARAEERERGKQAKRSRFRRS
jgi:hypothetical protein